MDCIASGDESSRPDEQGRWVYAMAFPMVRVDKAEPVRAGLRSQLPPGAKFLHFYDLSPKDRLSVARSVAELDWEAALIVVQLTSNRRQEQTRRRILTSALPRLEHVERVTTLLLESRAKGDRHDRRTLDRLRGSRTLGAGLMVQHVDKASDPLTWLADIVVGAILAKVARRDEDAWQALDDARLLEVTWLPHDRA